MYWLLNGKRQAEIRSKVSLLTEQLSRIVGNPQADQLFPYVGRKDRRKAAKVVEVLSEAKGLVVEPFAGSGSLVYAIADNSRQWVANEWEPYAWRMSNSPWRLPNENELKEATQLLETQIEGHNKYLYKCICSCGNEHVLDSLFFDRSPLNYYRVTRHERLGSHGENITYRGEYACPHCGKTEKHFDKTDETHLKELEKLPQDKIFQTVLIENSRINLNKDFLIYGHLFPHRSKLALAVIWKEISNLSCSKSVKDFFIDAFLSILPQAKFKDYRSKSQDLHCPDVQLREVNIFYRLFTQIEKRYQGLKGYSFSKAGEHFPVKCKDFRDFMEVDLEKNSADLILTDPPWCDGNAYFEKAQLYHPWLNYDLKTDPERLQKEFVVTDAPSRREAHNMDRWWRDVDEFFRLSQRALKTNAFLALFFRPIPARSWLANLNQLKLLARKNGFEPLLSIDVESSDPSMRIQQSAAYVFSQDIIFIFLKLEPSITRLYHEDIDVDQLAYECAEELQETLSGPFEYKNWRDVLAKKLNSAGANKLNRPDSENALTNLFKRYCDEVTPGRYLPKIMTPFSGQLFDTPAIERVFTYVPHIIKELTARNDAFSYDEFLLSLATYVENGTRALISQIEQLNIRKIIEPYAKPIKEGRYFQKRSLPSLPEGIRNIMELDPYDFENFVAHLLKAQGFTEIAIIGRAGDRGVDIQANDPKGKRAVIQCKRYINNNVSSTPVQRLHSFAVTRGAQRKILITTSDFTPQSREEAEATGTELVNGKMLEHTVAEYLPNFFKQVLRNAHSRETLFFKDIISNEDAEDSQKYVDCLPVYDLQAVATSFREQTKPTVIGWKPFDGRKLNNDMFIAQVVGKSMEPTIKDGSWCLFRFDHGGSRNGLIVLVESKEVSDPETQNSFTIKRYKSEKEQLPGDKWRHKRIALSPDNKQFKEIVLQNVNENDFRVVAEFLEVIK